MAKIRTSQQFQNRIDTEFGWRLKEISNLKHVVRSAKSLGQGTALRASIPLLYAHWEGFVKNSATMYVEYVNLQGLKYSELKSCFVVFGLKKHINELSETRKSSVATSALEFIRSELDSGAKLQIASSINTESNLSSKVFVNILNAIGVSSRLYETKFNLIDEALLDKRNHIAHGEYLDIDSDGFWALSDEIITILRMFKTDLENCVSLESFKVSPG